LNITAASNQPSAIVPLLPRSLQATNAGAGGLPTLSVASGRLVIIGPQPLLDIQLMQGNRNLVLYGNPGQSYQIQSETNLAKSGGWSDYLRVPMTNLLEVIPDMAPDKASLFFRAYEFTTTTPIVDEAFSSSGQELLVLYGTPGQAYEFDYTTALGQSWRLLELVPLTNSFAFVTGFGDMNQTEFYRYFLLKADPPLLQASLVGNSRSLVTFGLPGTNYTLQTTSNLSGTVAWNPLLSYTLTNSFQIFTNLGASSPAFYRLKKQ
jgi:hypothetical protein